MSECLHGMPSPSSCIDCMDEGNIPIPTTEPETVEYQFLARYEGSQCPSCNLPIAVGDLVAKMSSGRYLHNGCSR